MLGEDERGMEGLERFLLFMTTLKPLGWSRQSDALETCDLYYCTLGWCCAPIQFKGSRISADAGEYVGSYTAVLGNLAVTHYTVKLPLSSNAYYVKHWHSNFSLQEILQKILWIFEFKSVSIAQKLSQIFVPSNANTDTHLWNTMGMLSWCRRGGGSGCNFAAFFVFFCNFSKKHKALSMLSRSI